MSMSFLIAGSIGLGVAVLFMCREKGRCHQICEYMTTVKELLKRPVDKLGEVIKKITNCSKENQESNTQSRNQTPCEPTKPIQIHLLLVIRASHIPNRKLAQGGDYGKEEADELIRKTIRAYAYQDGDEAGKENTDKINREEKPHIDFDSEARVLVHLQIFASPEIIGCTRGRLIRAALASDRLVKVMEMTELAADSGTEVFYDIL